ncbi:MAG: class I SAM-dependent methyltransferase, partial [Tepidiformaceae bacterium]
EQVIRPVYNAFQEQRVFASLVGKLRDQSPERLLELGCGPGRALETLANAFPRTALTGVDLSPFMLERAASRLEFEGARVKLIHATGLAVPMADESVDAIVATHFFGHLPGEVAAAAWAETMRLLTPAGRLYLVDHAWHPHHQVPIALISEHRLLRGVLRFRVLQKLVSAPPVAQPPSAL